MDPEIIVDQIIADILNRRGLRQTWEAIDDDVKREIRETWISIISPISE